MKASFVRKGTILFPSSLRWVADPASGADVVLRVHPTFIYRLNFIRTSSGAKCKLYVTVVFVTTFTQKNIFLKLLFRTCLWNRPLRALGHAAYPKMPVLFLRSSTHLPEHLKRCVYVSNHRHTRLINRMLDKWMEEVEHPVDSRGYDRHRAEHALSSGDGTVQMALDFVQAKCRYQNV